MASFIKNNNSSIHYHFLDVKFYHFSIDDVYDPFVELTKNSYIYASVFDNHFFKSLKRLHSKRGSVISLYLLINNNYYPFEHLTTKYKKEFEGNSDWLKIGFHGIDGCKYIDNDTICSVFNVMGKCFGKKTIDYFS